MGNPMPNNLHFLGNQELLKLPKIAFLSSDKFSAGSVLKSYDWATEMKWQNQCVISGFQSKIEKDVFDILLKGIQPIILVLARGLYKNAPTKYIPHIESGRLLVVSPFTGNIQRPNNNLASMRNQFIIDSADEIVFAHIYKGGKLERLHVRDGVRVRVLDEE